MQTASFTGFIKTLFYIITFYYIFKFLAKLFLPIVVKKVIQKAGENFQQQQHAQGASWDKSQQDNEMIFDSKSEKKPRETKIVGEYVDYEEID